jgi:hypothetical protein
MNFVCADTLFHLHAHCTSSLLFNHSQSYATIKSVSLAASLGVHHQKRPPLAWSTTKAETDI